MFGRTRLRYHGTYYTYTYKLQEQFKATASCVALPWACCIFATDCIVSYERRKQAQPLNGLRAISFSSSLSGFILSCVYVDQELFSHKINFIVARFNPVFVLIRFYFIRIDFQIKYDRKSKFTSECFTILQISLCILYTSIQYTSSLK